MKNVYSTNPKFNIPTAKEEKSKEICEPSITQKSVKSKRYDKKLAVPLQGSKDIGILANIETDNSGSRESIREIRRLKKGK